MGKNKELRKKIKSWLRQIDIHEAKLMEELAKPGPDQGLVNKWRKDIRVFE